MAWQFEILPSGQRDLKTLDRPIRRQVLDRLEWFAEHFEEIRPVQLTDEWKGFYKLRVGDWRVMYTQHPAQQLLKMHYIDHRSRAYKKRR